MPVLQASQLSFQLDNGDFLFRDLSFSLSEKNTGLVGRNGTGKSVLAALITGEKTASKGTIDGPLKTAIYRQQDPLTDDSNLTIAHFLGVHPILQALQDIEQGLCHPWLFEQVGEQWTLAKDLAAQLKAIGINSGPYTQCGALSGGQLARLRLWKLFQDDAELLILDEPSNHMDADAKRWLVNEIADFSGHVLVISHDRQLLRAMDAIWLLDKNGLHPFGGNYDHYAEQSRLRRQSAINRLNDIDKMQKKMALQRQKNHEKAQKRAAKGKLARKKGDQPKILLNGMKNSAETASGSRRKQEWLAATALSDEKKEIQTYNLTIEEPVIHLPHVEAKKRELIRLTQAILPYGTPTPLNGTLYNTDKGHLSGANGTGKSTLLKLLNKELAALAGEVKVKGAVCYLDQHFSRLDVSVSLLDYLVRECRGITETQARTLLAGIGFRRDKVYAKVKDLSGGEKMKLAILQVSHQTEQPFLLLDEPDNHLDLDSKHALAEALNAYKGGFLLVSHDKDFVADIHLSQTFHLA